MKKQHLITAMALLFMPIVSSAEGERLTGLIASAATNSASVIADAANNADLAAGAAIVKTAAAADYARIKAEQLLFLEMAAAAKKEADEEESAFYRQCSESQFGFMDGVRTALSSKTPEECAAKYGAQINAWRW